MLAYLNISLKIGMLNEGICGWFNPHTNIYDGFGGLPVFGGLNGIDILDF